MTGVEVSYSFYFGAVMGLCIIMLVWAMRP